MAPPVLKVKRRYIYGSKIRGNSTIPFWPPDLSLYPPRGTPEVHGDARCGVCVSACRGVPGMRYGPAQALRRGTRAVSSRPPTSCGRPLAARRAPRAPPRGHHRTATGHRTVTTRSTWHDTNPLTSRIELPRSSQRYTAAACITVITLKQVKQSSYKPPRAWA